MTSRRHGLKAAGADFIGYYWYTKKSKAVVLTSVSPLELLQRPLFCVGSRSVKQLHFQRRMTKISSVLSFSKMEIL